MLLSLVVSSECCTVKDFLGGYEMPLGYESCLYLCVADGVVIYVGISSSPVYRVWQHLGSRCDFPSPSAFGSHIKNNLPKSGDWLLVFPSGDVLLRWLPERAAFVNTRAIERRLRAEGAMALSTVCEGYLISDLQPVFNRKKKGK